MFRHRWQALCTPALIGVSALLGACGNDDGVFTVATFSGQVAGSVIENARVCMDANRNGQCDAGESTTRTGRDGSFQLAIVTGADLIADIGTDAFVAERADLTDRKPVAARFVLRSSNALWTAGNNTVSAFSTMVSAELDNGVALNAARSKLADALAVDPSKILANYNTETDAVVKGTLQGYAKNLTVVLQGVAAAVAAGRTASRDLQVETRGTLTPVRAAGTVKYAWTQVGADDAPFSQLEITGIVPGTGSVPAAPTLTTNPAASGVNIETARFATRSASTTSGLYSTGSIVARAIVVPDASGAVACPRIRVDGVESTMTVRAPQVSGVASRGDFYGSPRLVDFQVQTCEARLPAGATSAIVDGRPLKVMGNTSQINRVLVIGDTGCRVKGPTAYVQLADGTATGGDRLQDCTSSSAWPFNRLSKVAASFNPDLILHNGDMHYREGFPEGVEVAFGGSANAANGGVQQDNATVKAKFSAAGIADSLNYGWRAWEEDFFKPTGPLLAVAPWALTRGNHELCDRAAQGWFRFLDPRNFPKAGSAYTRSDEPEYDGADGSAASFRYVRGSSFSNAKNCSQYTDPVSMVFGDLHLVLIDVGMMNDVPGLSSSMGSTNGDHVRTARQLTALSGLPASNDASKVTWIVGHKPLFAYAGSAAVASGTPQQAQPRTWQFQKAIIPGSETVGAGNGALPVNTQMTHAGHIHGFQMISQPAETRLPIAVLMGTSGDNLEGLIEANSGNAFAPAGFGNNITDGRWPWLDQVINAAVVRAVSWYVPTAKNPQNFSSSRILNAGRKETAVMTEYSFLVIDRLPASPNATAPNWQLQVYDLDRKLLRTCVTSGKTATCDG